MFVGCDFIVCLLSWLAVALAHCICLFIVTIQLKTLRQKWDEHTAGNIRAGTERKSRFVESLKLMTQLYQQKLTTPLKQIGKAVPPRPLISRQQEITVVGGTSRYPEVSSSATAQAQQNEDDNEEHDVGDRDDSAGEECERVVQTQAQRNNSNNNNSSTVSASELYGSQHVALEKQHLELFERQVAATEALAKHTREKLQVAKDKLQAAQEHVQVSRDQVELNLFAIQPDPEDEVAHEYLTLKRKQARDRLKDEFFALRRKQNGGSGAMVSAVAVPRPTTAASGNVYGSAAEARSSAALRTRSRRLSHELNDAAQSE